MAERTAEIEIDKLFLESRRLQDLAVSTSCCQSVEGIALLDHVAWHRLVQVDNLAME